MSDPDDQEENSSETGSGGPVGQGDYLVEDGDCMDRIAFRNGFFWETLWNLGENRELKETRKDPNILLPGDRLTIPPLREKLHPAGTEARHRFRLRGVPAKLRLRFSEGGEPRANEKYVLKLDGRLREGQLDANGFMEESIPPDAEEAILWLGDDDEEIVLQLGTVDPITEDSGIIGRLNNLGFQVGPEEDGMEGATREALKRFQEKNGLPADGKMDDTTRDKLIEAHGS